MLKRNFLKAMALITISGTSVVVASVPRSNEISNDTAIYQNLHEIKLSKVKALDFDGDIARLSAQEKQHREVLPMRLSAPMERVQNTPYRPGLKQNQNHKSRR